MKSSAWMLATVVMMTACGFGGGGAGIGGSGIGVGGDEICSMTTQCPSGKGSFKACTTVTGGVCKSAYFETTDGKTYACAGCGDCMKAALDAANWCSGSSPWPSPSPSPSPSPFPQKTCSFGMACEQGHSFQMCADATGTQCSYKRDDGVERSCGCNGCPEGVAWCEAFQPIVPPTGCSGYVDCLNTELQSGSDFSSAEATCDGNAKPGAAAKFQNAVGCGQQYCISTVSKCQVVGNQLVNTNGTPPNNGTPCGDCLNNALAGIFKDPCPNPGSADCNPSQCISTTNACLNDLP